MYSPNILLFFSYVCIFDFIFSLLCRSNSQLSPNNKLYASSNIHNTFFFGFYCFCIFLMHVVSLNFRLHIFILSKTTEFLLVIIELFSLAMIILFLTFAFVIIFNFVNFFDFFELLFNLTFALIFASSLQSFFFAALCEMILYFFFKILLMCNILCCV